ncbi:MAG: undecaprenyl-diphosphatase [Patiriisocius sp.]|jgi:undecaprenyl-diphosphatase
MFEKLEEIDRSLMIYLNGIHNPMFDTIMHYFSELLFWVPFFLWVIYLVYKKYELKTLGIFFLTAGLTVLLADRISVELFKNVFERLRPCHNGDIGQLMHLYDDKCGGQFGFVSSHATNFFGLAILFASVLKNKVKGIVPLMLIWATLVGYSRIYLGVHYPADVLGGAILGSVIGFITYRIFIVAKQKYVDVRE